MKCTYSDWYIRETLFAREGLDWKTVSRILIDRSLAKPVFDWSVQILNDPEDIEIDLSEDFGADYSRVMAVVKQSKLIQAAYHRDLDELNRLIAAGVDINARDEANQTALSTAARRGAKNVVSLLVQHGAQVDTYSSKNETPLMEVARSGGAEMASCLIAYGACIDAKGRDEITPLMMAAKDGHLDVIKVLLQNGADTTAKDSNGWTATMHASLAGKEEAFLLIREIMHVENGPRQLSVEDVQKANSLFASLEGYVQAGEHRILRNAILELENLLGRSDQIMLLHAQAFLIAGKLEAAACMMLDIMPENTDADFVLGSV